MKPRRLLILDKAPSLVKLLLLTAYFVPRFPTKSRKEWKGEPRCVAFFDEPSSEPTGQRTRQCRALRPIFGTNPLSLSPNYDGQLKERLRSLCLNMRKSLIFGVFNSNFSISNVSFRKFSNEKFSLTNENFLEREEEGENSREGGRCSVSSPVLQPFQAPARERACRQMLLGKR